MQLKIEPLAKGCTAPRSSMTRSPRGLAKRMQLACDRSCRHKNKALTAAFFVRRSRSVTVTRSRPLMPIWPIVGAPERNIEIVLLPESAIARKSHGSNKPSFMRKFRRLGRPGIEMSWEIYIFLANQSEIMRCSSMVQACVFYHPDHVIC